MQKVQWGVLSTAKIGVQKVIPGLQGSQWCEVRAIASRNAASAQAAADKLGIAHAYGSYEALLEDPAIEVVYNPLPNDLHVPWTLAAARAGKHVLCEKPFALTANEAAQLREVADKVHIMEAFMVRFHPQWLRARELVRSGALGEVRAIQLFFSYFNRDAANIRNRPDAGGGALYDIGCYALVAGRFLFEAEPLRVITLQDHDPQFGTDRTTSALMDFGQGRHLTFTVSTQTCPYQRVQVIGTQQRLEIEIPFNAPQAEETRLWVHDGKSLRDGAQQVENLPAADQYALQGDAFAQVVRGLVALPYGVEDAILNMRILDAMVASSTSGAWVRV
ncbi:Gfo/Idh/MocA family protein [Rhodoferax aquaticus]|uniref:Gfo/Idh/MocA family oxidoreductase n=1 Tax=Rhodoferax aquaticus TaxID=2527691 RepID=A0A515EV08_9BURK|nr:Gfo/Idh/MocA family oxidoreductase [Rhodoferax aquaticus]QDL56468.1 Gfo/Idh/MocA family oxidoreductase [Rhodoferax aquaticus]